MELADISGTTEISDEGIKKHFKSIDPWQPIFELVWNGLDAKANNVRVVIEQNTLGAITLVSIIDDGEGIEPSGLKNTFGRFNDSNKKEDASLRGAHGRGRLAFHRICNRATWFTNTLSGRAKIKVLAGDIKRFTATRLGPEEQHKGLAELQTGTLVELDQFTAAIPDANDLRKKFSVEFGWYLALHPSKTVSIDGVDITVPAHELYEQEISIPPHSFKAQIIRWEDKPSSEKSYRRGSSFVLSPVGCCWHEGQDPHGIDHSRGWQ